MTDLLIIVVESGYNKAGIVALIVWSAISIWWIGKVDHTQYLFPYLKKKKRRLKSLQEFEQNFQTLREKEGLSVDEYQKAVQYRSELKSLVDSTTYGPFYRYKNEDIYERDLQGNKIPDKSHITHFDDDGNPVYRGKVKEPSLMGDRNELRVMLIGVFMVILFIYFIITSA